MILLWSRVVLTLDVIVHGQWYERLVESPYKVTVPLPSLIDPWDTRLDTHFVLQDFFITYANSWWYLCSHNNQANHENGRE